MTRSARSRSGGSRQGRLVVFVLAFALALGAIQTAGGQQAPRAPDKSVVSGRDLALNPPSEGGARFRFLPDGPWLTFDRTLLLSAAERERRSYLVELQVEGSTTTTLASYLIDKLPPPPPRATPSPGLYRESFSLELSSSEGTTVLWALIGPGSGNAEFHPFTATSRPALELPASGTATYTLIAYAEDQAGNRSLPARYMYRLARPDLPAEEPAKDAPAAVSVATSGIPPPQVESTAGRIELSATLPEGSRLLLAVNPPAPPSSPEDFAVAGLSGDRSVFRIECPYGWSGELAVYYGVLAEGKVTLNPDPIRATLADLPEAGAQPATPSAPILEADPAGRGAFIVFPDYDGSLFVAVDGASPLLYTGPVAVPRGKDRVSLSWYGVDSRGGNSEKGSVVLDLPLPVPDVLLTGVEDGAALGSDVVLRPSATATIRYELRLDGSMPPEPGPSSPLVGDALSLTCPPGEARSVVVRYRAFAGSGPAAAAGESKRLGFTIDKRPPEAPQPAEVPPPYSDRSRTVLLKAASGSVVFASVSEEGKSADFAPVNGALELPGAETGPVTYTIRAFAVNKAGNRSVEMEPLILVVDRSSVYAASDARGGGDGSPDNPFASLDLALDAAQKAGKRSVNVRGSLVLGKPFAATAPIDIVGGFGAKWAKDRSQRATLSIAAPRGASALTARGFGLNLRALTINASAAGPEPLVLVENGSFGMEDCSLTASAEGDLVLARASGGSQVVIRRSSLVVEKAMAATVMDSEGSDVEVGDSIITAKPGVHVFGAFNMEGGSLALERSLIESSADLGLRLFSLGRLSLLIDRTLVRADLGSGYLRLGAFSAVSGEVRSSKLLVSWRGSGTLFEIEGTGPAFRHDTIVADTSGGSLRFFDISGAMPVIWNSILSAPAGGGELVRSSVAPGEGSLVADCIWGFSALVTGSLELTSLAQLDALNSGSALYSSRPHVSEPPSLTFASPVKNVSPLRPDSACVGAALPQEEGPTDLSGRALPSGARPDIGADQL